MCTCAAPAHKEQKDEQTARDRVEQQENETSGGGVGRDKQTRALHAFGARTERGRRDRHGVEPREQRLGLAAQLVADLAQTTTTRAGEAQEVAQGQRECRTSRRQWARVQWDSTGRERTSKQTDSARWRQHERSAFSAKMDADNNRTRS